MRYLTGHLALLSQRVVVSHYYAHETEGTQHVRAKWGMGRHKRVVQRVLDGRVSLAELS